MANSVLGLGRRPITSLLAFLPTFCRQTTRHSRAPDGTARYKLWLDARQNKARRYLRTLERRTSLRLRNRGSWVRIPLGALKNHQALVFATL
jgi:hypothetical protein